ncbi:MAG: bifunctional aspartate kinase/homoserine dehydrogenase I [Bdellovibrionales bacterium]|nr:bifunctional aspartate kinase/homoserine dehydrogenase I [Bdellovibrionales bacterium]
MGNLSWKAHKFGGTSLLNADRFKNVVRILTQNDMNHALTPRGPKVVVVSAMKGVTDELIRAVQLASVQNETYQDVLSAIISRHKQEIFNLFEVTEQTIHTESAKLGRSSAPGQIVAMLERAQGEIREILRGVWILKKASTEVMDLVSGLGEVWSAQILNAYLQSQGQQSEWLDAREVLVVETVNKRVLVDWERSREKLQQWRSSRETQLVVVTGFVAATKEGTKTTLGRNGSDYSGSIFGVLFDCDEIFIWTDVDGVMSADPRLVPEAVVLNELSYSEVAELAYFGAKVIHPSTLAPAIEKQVPIWIKNTLNPQFRGTKIYKDAKSDRPVQGFSIVDGMCLMNIEGSGMAGIPGVAERLFGALRSAEISVVLISQASSEHSICLAIPENQAQTARQAVEAGFSVEIFKKLINDVQITTSVSILAAVGDNMAHSPGIAGRFFMSLGRAGINVRAIAQGSSERNISAVIDSADAVKALRTVHSSFIVPHQMISLGLIGPGLIGKTFLRQLHEHKKDLQEKRALDVKVRGLANSTSMVLAEDEIPLNEWESYFKTHSQPLDLKKFTDHLKRSFIPNSVIVESTATEALTPFYENWLNEGLHIISPNKKANTSTMSVYRKIREAAKKSQNHFLYSTNVGAGLPLIQTLRDLYATGDRIISIQGILSGTLSFIFNNYDGSTPFSEIVKMAQRKGFTEPDPREDLSGSDVVRKIVILAREIGLNMELADVTVESLVPAHLQRVPVSEFLERLPELDDLMLEKLTRARADHQILRFVGSLNAEGQARVGLDLLPASHAFGRVTETDNIVLFKTSRYQTQPLVIQGPGAGPEVTAGGVFADLLRLAQYCK